MSVTALCTNKGIIFEKGSLCKFVGEELQSINCEDISKTFKTENFKILTGEEFNLIQCCNSHERLNKLKEFEISQNFLKNDKVYYENHECLFLEKFNLHEKTMARVQLIGGKIVETELINIKKENIFRKMKAEIFQFDSVGSYNVFNLGSFKKKTKCHSGQLKFTENIYLSASNKLDTSFEIFSFDETQFKNNELVEINNSNIFGRICCLLKKNNLVLACIPMTEILKEKLNKIIRNIEIKTDSFFMRFRGIIVKNEYLQKFNYTVSIFENFPNLDYQSIKYLEPRELPNFKRNEFVKCMKPLQYGRIKNTYLANNESCFEILWVYPSLSHESKQVFVRECDIIKVENPALEIEFHCGTIITPFPVLITEALKIDEFKIGDQVKFCPLDSLSKFKGSIQWIGNFNEIPSTILNLEEFDQSKIDYSLKIDEQTSKYFKEFKYENQKNLYILPLNIVKKSKTKEYEVIIEELLINKSDEIKCINRVIKSALNFSNPSTLPFIIENMTENIDLKEFPQLIPLLFERNQFETIKCLFDKSNSSKQSDLILLNIAVKLLQQENFELMLLFLKKCKNINRKLKNGETFLTSIFVNQISEDLIIRILKMKLFDMDIENNSHETPLLMACDRLMIDVIDIMLNSSNISHSQCQIALKRIYQLNETKNSIDDKDKIISITNNLSQKLANLNICAICMDNTVNVSFNCGHSTCKQCGFELHECPMCRKKITDRRNLYFS